MSKVFESREDIFKKWLELFNATCNNNTIIIQNSNIINIPLFLSLSLKYLDLSYNKIIEIPKEIGQLTSLKKLYLTNNKIIEIPKEIGLLISLNYLILLYNKIVIIPEEIGQLTSLKYLNLKYNYIKEIAKLNNCEFYI